MSVNDELLELYTRKLSSIEDIDVQLKNLCITDYVGPLLLYCWEDIYLVKSNCKILFIGQETNGWQNFRINNIDAIKCMINEYKIFELAKKKQSIFWQAIKTINHGVNGNQRLNFIWSNISKYGKNKKGRVSTKVSFLENEKLKILLDEIEILKPDAIVFLTGPSYDNDILSKIGPVKFISCSKYTTRQLARLENTKLPYKTFRTYHPTYLRRAKLESIIKEIVLLIKAN